MPNSVWRIRSLAVIDTLHGQLASLLPVFATPNVQYLVLHFPSSALELGRHHLLTSCSQTREAADLQSLCFEFAIPRRTLSQIVSHLSSKVKGKQAAFFSLLPAALLHLPPPPGLPLGMHLH